MQLNMYSYSWVENKEKILSGGMCLHTIK